MIVDLSFDTLLFGGILGAFAVWFGYRSAVALWRGLTFWRNEPVPVMDAANVDGTIELEGTALPGETTLRAPFTGTECLACEYEVEEYQSSGKNSSWRTLAEARDGVPFLLEDDTGSVAVEPDGASFALDDDARIESGRDETPPEPVQQFLDDLPDVEPEEGGEASLGPISVGTGDRRRYTERRIEPGDAVHVYGQSRRGRLEEAAGTVNAVVGDGDATPLFHVSDGSEADAVRRQLRRGGVYLLIGVGALALGAAFLSGLF